MENFIFCAMYVTGTFEFKLKREKYVQLSKSVRELNFQKISAG